MTSVNDTVKSDRKAKKVVHINQLYQNRFAERFLNRGKIWTIPHLTTEERAYLRKYCVEGKSYRGAAKAIICDRSREFANWQ